MITSLSDYGYAFQVKLLTSLLTDSSFTRQIIDILDPKFFESDSTEFVVKSINHYFYKYNCSPTFEALKVYVASIEDDVLKATVISLLKDVLRNKDSSDLEIVKEKAIDFCKNQTLKAAIMESVDLLETSDYDSIKEKIDTAIKAGTERNLGLDYKLDVRRRYEEDNRNPMPTGWDPIDSVMDGGLSKGEVGVIAGSAGAGKSWILQSIAATSLKAGKSVVFYTLELDEAYTGRRFDSLLTGINVQDLKYNIEEIEKRVSKLKGNLSIKYFPEQSITVHGIKAHLDKYVLMDQKPDLVVIDYVDCLKPIMNTARSRSDQLIGDMYGMLKNISGELGIPVWTASQTNRESSMSDIVQGHQIAESYMKVQKADFIVSISRKVEDKLAGVGRWHIIKNRFGPDGLTYPSKLNMSNGRMDIYEPQTVQGKTTQKKIDNNNEYARKYLKTKFNELRGGKDDTDE